MSMSTQVEGANKRRETRNPITHKFTLAHKMIGEVSCSTRDLSLKGAFVEGDFAQLGIGTSIDVSFDLPSKRPGSTSAMRYRFSAIVVRRTDTGAGLNFAGLDTTTDAAIYDLMHR